MSKKPYFEQYVSPNIVIVPTLSFLPPCKENKADPNTNSDRCEQNSVNILSKTSTSSSNSEKNITKEADCISELNYPHKKDTSPTEEQGKYVNQSIKELSSNTYKSRNNLVDFTGFNIHKRDSSLTKHKDTERKQLNTEQNNIIKSMEIKENEEYLHSHTHIKNVKGETSKSEGLLNISCKGNTKENTSNGSQQDNTNMEDKMKKYFRHLWKRNIGKLKDQSNKRQQNSNLKPLKTKQNCKDSRREPSQSKSSKPKLEVAAKQSATKSLNNKTINSSTKYSSRSKSESKSSLQSLRDRERYLSPDSITRYKQFQRFLRNNENDDDKYNTEKQIKKENSQDSIKHKTLKSNKTIQHAEPKKLIERKLPVKSDLHSNKNVDNKNPMKLVKSVVTQVNKNIPNNYPLDKCDLRSRLSRKRTRSECFTHSQQTLENKMDRKDLIITVKQDVNRTEPDPKILAKNPPKNRPKTRKCKKIKLVINIECPASDSEDSDQNANECCTSPQDLSFLDDFDVDEIVDLLNTNHSQAEGSTKSSEMSQINNTNENHQLNKNDQEHKSKGRLIKATNIKNSINKAKNVQYEKLAGDKCHDQHENEIQTNSSFLENKFSNRGEANIKKPHDKNRESSVTAIKKSLKIVKDRTNKKVGNTKNIKPLSQSNTNAKKITKKLPRKPDGCIQTVQVDRSTAKNAFNVKSVKPSHINTMRADDSIEASLETMFNDDGRNNNIETDDVQLIISKKETNDRQISKIEDTIEASLNNMFNSIPKETGFNANINITNTCQHIKQEEIIPTTQQITKVLVEPHNQKANDRSEMTFINNSESHIKLESETLQNVEALILSDTPKNNIEQKVSTKINSEQLKNSNENFKQKYNDTNKKSPEIPINITKKTDLEVVKHTNNNKHVNVTSLSRPNKNIKKKEYDSKKSKDPKKNSLKPSNSLVNKPKHKSSFSSVQLPNSIAEYEVDNQVDVQTLSNTNENVKELQNSNVSINIMTTTKNAEKTFNVKTNIEPSNINTNIIETEYSSKPNHTTQSSVATNNNITEKRVNIEMQVESLNIPDKNVNENTEKLQISGTITKLQEKPIKNNKLPINSEQNIDEKSEKRLKTYENHQAKTRTNVEKDIEIQMDFELSNISDKNSKQNAESLMNSTNTVKDDYSAKNDIKNSKKFDINIKDNAKPIQILTDISKNSQSKEKCNNNVNKKSEIENLLKQSNKTISENLRDTRNLEVKINNAQKITENISNTKMETNVNNLQNTKCTSEKSLITMNDAATNKNAGTETPSGKSVAKANNSMPTVEKKHTKASENGSIKTEVKPNSEGKHEKSQEKVTSNGPKPETINDIHKAEVSTVKGAEKNNNSNKLDEKVETNTKQKQVHNNDNIVSNGAEKKQEAKSDKPKNKEPPVNPFVKNIEERMLSYLGKQFNVTSLVHSGRFSVIYKCKDDKGENYAVKVKKGRQLRNKGMYMETMLAQLQKYRSIKNSSIISLINGFGVQGFWCLLTDYYPKNLEEALKENKRSFHIELVQVLARQLIDAVNMLTNSNIIHSDIKPTHILLNSHNDRLKLCGFDRADYIDRIDITPKTGTPSYRAPEVILGFSEDIKIDVWSTALVIFEMATKTKLFPGLFNNDILYKQICTLGSFDWEMMEYCRHKNLHFKGLSFMRRVGPKGEKTVLVHAFHRNKRIRKQLHKSAQSLTEGEAARNKLEKLHTLLEQMLLLDPRQRLPIQFAGASEFIQDIFT